MVPKSLAPAAVMVMLGWPAFSNTHAQPESADPAQGATLYAENCASCHGENLEGQPDWRTPTADGTLPAPPHDETGHTWHHGDATLFEYTKLGGKEALRRSGATGFTSGMPGFGEQLSDQEIWHILAFIKSQWVPEVQAVQRERTAAEQTRP